MGQNNSKTVNVRKEIENEIATTISNTTKNITNIVNSTTNNVSTEMAQSAAADIKTSTAFVQKMKTGKMIIRGSKVNLEQQGTIQAENDAIVKIVQSAQSMQEMANKIASGVENAVKNDSAAAASLKQAAALSEATKNAGGPEELVKSVMGTVDKMVGALNVGGSTSDNQNNETRIRQKIKNDINNTTINENNISNAIVTNIKNSMAMAAEAKCNLDLAGGNEMIFDDILVAMQDGERGELTAKQSVSMKSFNKCFIDLNMGSKIVNAISGEASTFNKSDTSNKNKTDATAEQEAAIKKLTIQESGLTELGKDIVKTTGEVMNNAITTTGGVMTNAIKAVGDIFKISPMFMIMIVGGGITAAVAAYFYSQSGKGQPDGMGPYGPPPNGMGPPPDGMGPPPDGMGPYGPPPDGMGPPPNGMGPPPDGMGPDGLPIQVGGLFGFQESEIYGMTEELMGGSKDPYGNVYLWALIAVLIYYVYGKTLPGSSITVIVIIAYIIYKSKEKEA
jgi:hypothetical protein